MSSSDPDLLYVLHIQERIERIEEIATQDRAAFDTSHILQDAVIRNAEEAQRRLKAIADGRDDVMSAEDDNREFDGNAS